MNAICSKNDEAAARARARAGRTVGRVRLRPHRLVARRGPGWPASSRTPSSGPRTSSSSTTCPSNLGEAEHFAPGLQTAGPGDHRPTSLELPELAGKDDHGLDPAASSTGCWNASWPTGGRRRAPTRSSSGRATSGSTVHAGHGGRSSTDSTSWSCAPTSSTSPSAGPTRRSSPPCWPTPRWRRATSRWRDRYGDYGICGFYALDRLTGDADRLPLLVPGARHGRRAVALRPPGAARARHRGRGRLRTRRDGRLDHPRRRHRTRPPDGGTGAAVRPSAARAGSSSSAAAT